MDRVYCCKFNLFLYLAFLIYHIKFLFFNHTPHSLVILLQAVPGCGIRDKRKIFGRIETEL